jgi:hypothetical protein
MPFQNVLELRLQFHCEQGIDNSEVMRRQKAFPDYAKPKKTSGRKKPPGKKRKQ